MRGAAAVVLVLGAAGCAARRPDISWIERDARGSDVHATRPAGAAGAAAETVAAPVELATLDAAAIDRLDEATALGALDRAGTAAPAARLGLRAARLAYHRGDGAIARARLERARAAADAPLIQAELDALALRLAQPPVDPKLVAVLLPLTGRFAAIGAELKLAIQLAPAAGTTWLFVDTRGEVDGAVAGVETAIAKGAAAILGPVGEREAIAAARAASLHGIAIALLAPADGADPAAGVFRVVESAADEGRAVARLAAAESFPTVAVLAPRDDVGRDTADAFTAEATRLGLAVTAQGSYDPTGGALEPDVKDFLGLVPARNPRFAEHLARHGRKGWTTFSPEIPFTLLYVPDRHDRAALVAAYLPYFNVELRATDFPDPARLQRKHGGVMPQIVQLVGGAGWNHPTLPIRGGPAVQGALIVDAFAGALGDDLAVAFAAAFRQRTSRAPSATAAQAHDAAALVAAARTDVVSRGTIGDVRGSVRAALARARIAGGACGPAAIGPDGEVVREPIVLEVQGDQLVLAP